MFLATSKTNVVLCHPTRRVTHEFSESFDVHSIDDRLGTKVVAKAVQLHVVGQFCPLAEPTHSQPKVRPVPYRSMCRQEHPCGAGSLVVLDSLQQLHHAGHQLDYARTWSSLRSARFVLAKHDHALVEVNISPG